MTTQLYHTICQWLRELIAGTQWEGHVYAVGGCCRDQILGLEINDLDLAIDLPNGGVKFARWLQKKHLVSGRPIFFLKFGTAKLSLRRFPDEEIEMVQTRREQYTKETSRCPEVCFGSIEDDCWRRDFTVNSLYYDITRDRMVDITGMGIPDMHAGVLRTPLDPDETFNDDPVRILRGLRFANRFNWEIDPPVMAALLRHVHRIDIVSRERCHSELCKMINGPRPLRMMQTLRETGVLKMMIPELAHMADSPALWKNAMERLATLLSNDPDAPTRLRLAALMQDAGPTPAQVSKIVRHIMTVLRFDRPIVSDVAYLVRFGKVTADKLDNPRRMREVQNLAVVPERFNLLLRYISDLGRPEDAAKIQDLSEALVAKNQSGFTPVTPGRAGVHACETAEKDEASEPPKKKHRRGGRKHRRRRTSNKAK